MSDISKNISMIEIDIHVYPDNERFSFTIDETKSVKDLKNELVESRIIKGGEYYVKYDDNIINDDISLKDYGIKDRSSINIIENDYITIKMEIRKWYPIYKSVYTYLPMSNFRVIKADGNKMVEVCSMLLYFIVLIILLLLLYVKKEEIMRVINLLKDNSSDYLSILNDINILVDKSLLFNFVVSIYK